MTVQKNPSSPLAGASEPLPTGPTATKGRDGQGRFAAGNAGGPGNPFNRRVASLRESLLKALSAEDLQGIAVGMVQKAKEGDVAAARLVLAYAVGKPTPAVDPDGLDLHEWQLWQQGEVPVQAMQGLVGTFQAPVACILARALLPLLRESLAQELSPKSAPTTSTLDQGQPRASEKQETTPLQGKPLAGPDPGPAARNGSGLGGTKTAAVGDAGALNPSRGKAGPVATNAPDTQAR